MEPPQGCKLCPFPPDSPSGAAIGPWVCGLKVTFPSHASLLLAEFFIDGLGSLLVGSCSDVIIGHQPHSPVEDPELAALEKTYRIYRANTNDKIQFKLALHYFKNHLQCAT